MVNVNGLDNKSISLYQEILLRANNEQLPMMYKMLDAEISKRRMFIEAEERKQLEVDPFCFSDVFDINKNKRLNS